MRCFLDNRNAFQPDIIFIANENLYKIREDGIYGAPDLIIEILLPGTAQYDKGKKKKVYESNAVKEYWIIAPADNLSEGFFFEKEQFASLRKATAQIQSKLLKTVYSF